MKKEYLNKNIKELKEELRALLKEKFNLKFQCSMKKLQHTHLLRNVKKNISRIYTLITERERIKKNDKK